MLLECATLHNTAGSHESDIEDISKCRTGSRVSGRQLEVDTVR